MSLRQVVITNPGSNTILKMVRVAIADDVIVAIWRIESPSGVTEAIVPVGDTLYANLTGRVAFQTMLDNIEADTQARVPTP